MINSRFLLIFSVIIACFSSLLAFNYARAYWYPFYLKIAGARTVAEAVDLYSAKALSRLSDDFSAAGVGLEIDEIALLAVKQDKILELWIRTKDSWKYVKTYPVLAASGVLGPKLAEGDKQVPEGIYAISGLNPNSAYHLSMKLNYPNSFDQYWAQQEGRNQPGTNIFIHGKAVSIGCLAMGDAGIEELFVLVEAAKTRNVNVIIAPTDPRKGELVEPLNSQPWVTKLYSDIHQAFIDITGT